MADIKINYVVSGEQAVIGGLRRIGEVAVDALGSAVKAFASVGVESVKVAADFESTLNTFASVTGDALTDAGMQVSDFSDLFLEMGAQTKYSAGEAAQAAVELAKGGLDPATIAAGGLESALTLAAAGQLELATAAEITAKQLGVWGDTGVTAANVADLMAQAANASTVNVDELALGMANVGGVAKVTGASFEETVQAMALLAPGFSSASDAGTSLKTFLSRMIPASDEAAGAMLELGLASEDANGQIQSNFFDANGAFIGMGEAADLLNDSLAGLSEADKLDALGTIFGQDAIRAAAMLGEAGAEGFDKMGDSMLAAGSAAEQSAKLNQGFNFALESLMGSLETIQIVIGTALLPTLSSFINDAIIPAVNSFLEWAQVAMPVIIAGLQEFGGVILGILGTIDFAPLMAAFAGLFDAMGGQMPTAGATMQAVAAGITAAVQGIADFMNTVLIPVLTTVVSWVAENWPTIQLIAEAVAAGITVAVQGITDFMNTVLIPVLTTVVSWVAENWPTIQLIAETVFTAIETVVNHVLTNIQYISSLFTAALEGDWHKFGEILREGWDRLWTGIQEIVVNAIAWFSTQDWGQIGSDIIAGIAAGITAAAKWISDAALAAVQAAVDAVEGFLGIESPSKLFKGIGVNAGLGMAQGFEATDGAVASAAVGSAQVATGAVNNYYNLTIHSGGTTNTGAEFGRMRAIAGAF